MRGIKPFNASGRFVYEPEAAAEALWSLIRGEKAPNVRFYSAELVAAADQDGNRFVDIRIEGTGSLRLNTRYFIDSSVEGDLARMLGADYRVGRGEAVYNDLSGPAPAYPAAENNYETAPQRILREAPLGGPSGQAAHSGPGYRAPYPRNASPSPRRRGPVKQDQPQPLRCRRSASSRHLRGGGGQCMECHPTADLPSGRAGEPSLSLVAHPHHHRPA
jgi:hypothetical protein